MIVVELQTVWQIKFGNLVKFVKLFSHQIFILYGNRICTCIVEEEISYINHMKSTCNTACYYYAVQVLDQLNVMLISCSQHHCVLSSSTRILARCGTIVVPNGLKVGV